MKNSVKYICYIFIVAFVISGCEDQIIETYTANVPIYITYDELRASVQSETSRSLENTGKIYFYNDYLFINEYLDGIHIIDNSDPSTPQNIGFINIPGNVDIAVKDDILYADSYVDLVALDISNLNSITEVNRLEDIFPYILPPYDENYRVDEIDYEKGVVIDWELKKVTREVEEHIYPVFPWYGAEDYMLSSYSNGTAGHSSGATSFGVGGSMARFTAIENVLYTVDSYTLKVIDIETVDDFYLIKSLSIGWNIETLFPTGDHLFIGSQSGMLIYDISNPYNPTYVSDYWHITSCDPVVVEGDYAYVTLRSGNWCGETVDQLDVIDISNLAEPTLVRSYNMTEPYGLGIDNSTLFICDGSAGLKIYDASDVMHITDNIIATFPSIETYDVIPLNGVLMLIGDDGLYQYDYSDLTDIQLLSTISITN
ncbi:LVIVD repeat-containing protein [Bacteroidota bacterium]